MSKVMDEEINLSLRYLANILIKISENLLNNLFIYSTIIYYML